MVFCSSFVLILIKNTKLLSRVKNWYRQTCYMFTIDLNSEYWLVSVKMEDRNKTGFITPFGLFRFARMPFRMRNAPVTFQRLADRFRRSLPKVMILSYLDDTIIISSSFDNYLSFTIGKLRTDASPFQFPFNMPEEHDKLSSPTQQSATSHIA